MTLNKRPILSPLSSSYVKSLLPADSHSDLHHTLGFDYYKRSIFFSTFSFKWFFGNFRMATYEPHSNLYHYNCPFCPTPHPLDPVTFVAECCTMDTFRQEMFQAWPSPFKVITAVW